MALKVLFLGEIVGRAGLTAVKKFLPSFRTQEKIDLVIANGEGTTGGFGLGKNHALYLRKLGVDVVTVGEKGFFKKDLLDLIFVTIELANITKIYRYKKYFNESNEVIKNSLFLEFSRIPIRMYDKLIEAADADELMKLLANSRFKVYLGDHDYPYIEYYVEEVKYNVAKRNMRFSSSGPLVYLTYSILQRIEIDNLKHIIEGIRYGRDASSIEDTLIYA